MQRFDISHPAVPGDYRHPFRATEEPVPNGVGFEWGELLGPTTGESDGDGMTSAYADYEGARPYFELVRQALGDLVDGEHFFDVVSDDIVYEVLYDLAGWPRAVRGRTELMAKFRGYVDFIKLRAADHLIVRPADDGRVVVIEYEVHGTILKTGVEYDNRFCSIITIEDRKIAGWRDYMNSLAAWNALTAPRR